MERDGMRRMRILILLIGFILASGDIEFVRYYEEGKRQILCMRGIVVGSERMENYPFTIYHFEVQKDKKLGHSDTAGEVITNSGLNIYNRRISENSNLYEIKSDMSNISSEYPIIGLNQMIYTLFKEWFGWIKAIRGKYVVKGNRNEGKLYLGYWRIFKDVKEVKFYSHVFEMLNNGAKNGNIESMCSVFSYKKGGDERSPPKILLSIVENRAGNIPGTNLQLSHSEISLFRSFICERLDKIVKGNVEKIVSECFRENDSWKYVLVNGKKLFRRRFTYTFKDAQHSGVYITTDFGYKDDGFFWFDRIEAVFPKESGLKEEHFADIVSEIRKLNEVKEELDYPDMSDDNPS